MSSTNPYLIPLNANNTNKSSQQQQKRPQAQTISFGGANNNNGNCFSASTSLKPKLPSSSQNNNSNSRRSSLERVSTIYSQPVAVVVRFKSEIQQQLQQQDHQANRVTNNIISAAVPRQNLSPSPLRNNTHQRQQQQKQQQRNHLHDDDDIERFIYEDNEKTFVENNNDDDHQQFLEEKEFELLSSSRPPASDDAAKELKRMIQEQERTLLEIRIKRDEQQQQQQHQTEENPKQQNTKKQQVENFMLPTTFRPIPPQFAPPPPRWKVPPSLPPRRRLLVADGPRSDLLDMLDKLQQEEEEEQEKKNHNNNFFSQSTTTTIRTGSRVTSELWVFIFEFLDPRELCRCAEVCRRWLCIARSEFLWSPILTNHFQHLIESEEDERRFQERTSSNTGGGLSLAPPPPNRQQPANSNTDAFSMCPSLARICNFVTDHRGRIRQELETIQNRLTATENRIQRNNNINAQNIQQQQQIPRSSFEIEITNERQVLLRQIQELEPRLKTLLDRVRDAETTQVTQSRALNEAIVSSKRSGLQLTAIHRRSQIADRRHKELVALDELERRLCHLVLGGAGSLLPVSLRKSIRHFSQLELLLMSCATQEALSELPKRWAKVKEVISVELLEELRKNVEESEDPNGLLGSCLLSSTNNNINTNPSATVVDGDSKRIRFADSLFSKRRQEFEQQQHQQPPKRNNNNHTDFSQDHQITKRKIVAEMALTMNDYNLEKFLFS